MRTLAEPAGYEETIKKSRFVCQAARADSPEEAQTFLQAVRDAAATHNCWAYQIDQQYRFSDDGEPGGTAGQPILRAINGHGLQHVIVVVTRYFGGVKLGTGGLVRAYGGVAAECLRRARLVEVPVYRLLQVRMPHDVAARLYHLLAEHGAQKVSESYDSAEVTWLLRVAEPLAGDLELALRNASKGIAKVVALQ